MTEREPDGKAEGMGERCITVRFGLAPGLARLAVAFVAVQLAVAILGPPRSLVAWLTMANTSGPADPAAVVVLGGGGIPSESGLIRTYYGAQAGVSYPAARCVVALPADTDPEQASVGRMRDELVMRGVAPERILMETRGRSTAEQAVRALELLGPDFAGREIVLISSPLHLRRAAMAFRKAGFRDVRALAAQNTGAEADLGQGTSWRYGFWSNWESEGRIVRELIALLYYRLRGLV